MTIVSPNATHPWFVGGDKTPRLIVRVSEDQELVANLPDELKIGIYATGGKSAAKMTISAAKLKSVNSADRLLAIDFDELSFKSLKTSRKFLSDGKYYLKIKSKSAKRLARKIIFAQSPKFRVLNGMLISILQFC